MAARAAAWAQVRASYERGVSFSELSRSSGLSRAAIRVRARAEGWTKPETPQPSDVVSSGPLARVGTTSSLDSLPDERNGLIRQHRCEWRDLDRLRREAIRAASCSPSLAANPSAEEANRMGSKEQLGQAKLLMTIYKTAVEGLTTKQEGERRAHGFDYKLQQETGTVDKEKAERDARIAKEFTEWADSIGLSAKPEDVH